MFNAYSQGLTLQAPHEVGLVQPEKLPRQIELDAPNPFKDIVLEKTLRPDSSFTDYDIYLRKKTLKEYGAYMDVRGPGGKVIPLTTPAVLLDYVRWLLLNNAPRHRELKKLRSIAMAWYDKALTEAGVSKGFMGWGKHVKLMRTTVLPSKLALDFWTMTRQEALSLEAVKVRPDFIDKLEMLGDAFWKAAIELARGVGEGMAAIPEWLFKMLKWIVIGLAVAVSGMLAMTIIRK
jgi:hypothetical protein